MTPQIAQKSTATQRLPGQVHLSVVLWFLCASVPLLCFCGVAGTLVFAEGQSGTVSREAAEAIKALQSKDAFQRRRAFLRLEALREPATIEAIGVYLKDRDPERRAASVRSLAAVAGAPAIPVVLQKLKTDRHPSVRMAALFSLEPFQAQDPAILPAFIETLRDRSALVRMAAVDVVSRVKDPRAKAAILAHDKIEHRPDVRKVLKGALERVKQQP